MSNLFTEVSAEQQEIVTGGAGFLGISVSQYQTFTGGAAVAGTPKTVAGTGGFAIDNQFSGVLVGIES